MQDFNRLNSSCGMGNPTSVPSEPGQIAPLIKAAREGSETAWRELYRRYHRLISHTARKFPLSESNVDDLCQTVWLQLLTHLKDLREPKALPGWLVTTARNEAMKMLKANRRCQPADPQIDPRLQQVDHVQPDENLDRMARRQVLHSVIGELRSNHRELLALLMADPQIPYSEISRRLGIPVGSIGPTRARCISQLRGNAALRAFRESAHAA